MHEIIVNYGFATLTLHSEKLALLYMQAEKKNVKKIQINNSAEVRPVGLDIIVKFKSNRTAEQ